MTIDLEDLGIDLEENEAEEETEQEEQEGQNPTPTKEEPKKPQVDHSVPPRQRIEEERAKLKFEGVVMASMQRQAAKIIGDMILWEFDNYPEREQEWDYNEWTLVDFLKAFAEKARQEVSKCHDQALFAGRTEDPSDPTMELVRAIIHTKNEPPKPAPKPSIPTTKPKTSNKPKAEKPAIDHEQLKLDLDGII